MRIKHRSLVIGLLLAVHANAHALGFATPTDIPGLVILDANVPAESVNLTTVGAGGNPPFQPGSTVYKVQTTQPFVAIRSYHSPWEDGKSGQAGGWIAPLAETRGLSRAQLMDRLALPVYADGSRNNTFALVLVPAGVTFWSGPAGAITHSAVAPLGAYWGSGGGIQYYVGRNAGDIPGFQVPLANYVLAAPMGEENLLAYHPRLSGNALAVGRYMDNLAVPAYSDLDRVLTALDLINLSTPADDPKLQKAIAPLGAERYGALALTGLYQSRRFMDQVMTATLPFFTVTGDSQESGNGGRRSWMSIQESRAQQASDTERTGFKHNATALVGGMEISCQANRCFGIAGSVVSADLDWSAAASGNGKSTTGYVGGYGSYPADALLLTGQLFLGYSTIDTARDIRIPDAGLWPGYSFAENRAARGSTHATTTGARLDIGHVVSLEQTRIVPFIGLEYQRFYRQQLSESGAGSINLAVDAQTLDETRLRFGVSLAHTLPPAGNLSWSLESHWLGAPRIGGQSANNSGKIEASFQNQGTSFSANGWRPERDLNQISIGLSGKGKAARVGLTYHYLKSADFKANTLLADINWRF